MKIRPPYALIAFAALGAAPFSLSLAGDQPITEFEASEDDKLEWRVVDDGVMGGLSKGKISFTDSGTMKFSGKLSLENNGGFSSVRTTDVDLDLQESEGLAMRVKGDGRTYQLRLNTDARYRSWDVSFKAEFATTQGEWIEVQVPFSALVGSFHGRLLEDEEFDPDKIQRIGFLLGDKKPGPFQLEVDWIRAYDSEDAAKKDGTGNLVETAIADGRFNTLATALTKADLLEALQSEGPLTVFAPTDEAFAKLPEETVTDLLQPKNKEKLQAILKYHVVSGGAKLSDALKASTVATLQGDPINIAFTEGRIRVNAAALVDADIQCSNGIFHVIDSVLLPPDPKPKKLLEVAAESGNFTKLLAGIEAAGLSSVFDGEGPFTVFAPTDEAVDKLPEDLESLLLDENRDKLQAVLIYHVVSGRVSAGDALNAGSAKTVNGESVSFAIRNGRFFVNDSIIRTVDIECANGVIHVVDAVLFPPTWR